MAERQLAYHQIGGKRLVSAKALANFLRRRSMPERNSVTAEAAQQEPQPVQA
jgi:hypothetical protein